MSKQIAVAGLAVTMIVCALGFFCGDCMKANIRAQQGGKTDLTMTLYYHGPALPDTLRLILKP